MNAVRLIPVLVILLFCNYACKKETVEEEPDDNNKPDPVVVEKPGTWEQMSNMPYAMTETSVATMNNKLYVVGGCFVEAIPTEKILEYDPASDSWSEFANLPTAFHHHAAVALNGQLYAIGGYTGMPPTGKVRKNVIKYDEETGDWVNLSSLPNALCATTASVVNNKIYLFGGLPQFNKGIYNSEVLRYDPNSNRWTKVANFTNTREHLGSAVFDNKIYVVGGRTMYPTQGGFETFNSIDCFNPSSNSFASLTDIPIKTSASSVAALNGCIYTFHGESASGGFDSFMLIQKSYEYNITTGVWREIKASPTPVHGTNAVTIGNAIYIVGGSTVAGTFDACNKTYKFTINE